LYDVPIRITKVGMPLKILSDNPDVSDGQLTGKNYGVIGELISNEPYHHKQLNFSNNTSPSHIVRGFSR